MKAVILAGGFGTRISEESVMKVGITFSTFDLFHAGHVKLFERSNTFLLYLTFN